MIRIGVLAALFAALVLAGCRGGAQQTGKDVAQDVAVGIQRNLSVADLAALKSACTASAPALVAATGTNVPSVLHDTAVYPYAFCAQLLTGQTGNADQSSLTWLPRVLSAVESVARIAGVVLPAVLPLVTGR